MSRLIWSSDAENDLDELTDYYLSLFGAAIAVQIRDEIELRLAMLADHPMAGRVGRVEGTREMVLAQTPFIAIYGVNKEVLILRILHGAQQWP